MQLPIWRCHKQVEAFQIFSITARPKMKNGEVVPPQMVQVPHGDGFGSVFPSAQKTEYVLRDVSGLLEAVVSDEFVMDHHVHTGGYFVRYENGYESFSPQAEFEAGYLPGPLKRMLHLKIGSDDWQPTQDDLIAIIDMFAAAAKDPEGSVVGTYKDFVHSEIKTVGRTDDLELVTCEIHRPKRSFYRRIADKLKGGKQ